MFFASRSPSRAVSVPRKRGRASRSPSTAIVTLGGSRSAPNSTAIHLVAVAAGARKDEYGKKERIYANAKSLRCFHDKIEDAFGRDVDLSAPVWAHGVEGATTQLAALTRGGELRAETDAGISLQEAADRHFLKQPSNANRSKPKNFNPALEIAKTWRPAMRSSSPRDFAHVILSAKPGTDEEAFMDAARATLAREFKGHEYVFVMHTNRRHIHVHAAVRLTSATGEKLHPGIQDFNRWRQTLAEEARERHIPMEAVRRFDQAHAPAYKLKDAKMVERGIAPESVRRRVERVKAAKFTGPRVRRAVAAPRRRSLNGNLWPRAERSSFRRSRPAPCGSIAPRRRKMVFTARHFFPSIARLQKPPQEVARRGSSIWMFPLSEFRSCARRASCRRKSSSCPLPSTRSASQWRESKKAPFCPSNVASRPR